MNDETFDKTLKTLIDGMNAEQILRVPGAYELFAEELNNDVFDMAEDNAEQWVEAKAFIYSPTELSGEHKKLFDKAMGWYGIGKAYGSDIIILSLETMTTPLIELRMAVLTADSIDIVETWCSAYGDRLDISVQKFNFISAIGMLRNKCRNTEGWLSTIEEVNDEQDANE